MTFKNAIMSQTTTTTNGMVAFIQSNNACVDLFYKIGASRGKNIIPDFIKAYVENPDLALRIVLWARDARQGAGERELFHQVLNYLEINQPKDALRLMKKIPELGRYDDLLVFNEQETQTEAFSIIKKALEDGQGLAAKWMPRKGILAQKLRKYMNLSSKDYRHLLVGLTHIVEQQMCKNEWDSIDFSTVPSLAHARYRRAFSINTPSYKTYIEKLVKKEPSVKINAGAVYPYDVLKSKIIRNAPLSKLELDALEQQWAALPNYVGDAKILPIVDVSGSMQCHLASTSRLTALDVAVSLGLYFADKNTGSFKDCILTFSMEPQLINLTGSIVQKIDQLVKSHWGMNTNLNNAFQVILKTAINNQVKTEEMPQVLMIISDMQFDYCVDFSSMAMIKELYASAGYEVPAVVFWNINAYSNVPVQFNEQGVALISGFSPIIAQSLLKLDLRTISPEKVMLETVMKDRYDPSLS